MAIIITNKGEEILVDDDKFEELNTYKWLVNPKGYAFRSGSGLMHRYLTKCPKGLTVDHINMNKLDNRLENLEIVTSEENLRRRHHNEWIKFLHRNDYVETCQTNIIKYY